MFRAITRADAVALMLLLGIALGLFVSAHCQKGRHTHTHGGYRHTRFIISSLVEALDEYYQRHTSFPLGTNARMLDALVQDNIVSDNFFPSLGAQSAQVLVDSWGTPLRYYAGLVGDRPAYCVYSQGANTRDEGGQGDDYAFALVKTAPSGGAETWRGRPPWFDERWRERKRPIGGE